MADSEGVVAPGNQRGKSSVTSEDWKEIQACFEQILEAPAAERPLILDAIGDAELRREVESLLHAHREAGAFLEEPDHFFSSESFKANTLSAGAVIDRYRIIREIGRGGMGAVFLAERADDEYRKRVAIKVIKRGTDTDSVLRHFRNERQILASLEHPNIARLLDGGTTDDGLPYFVMEYIEGERVDQYAEQQRLSITARLELFRQVCGAVSYAHQNLVVHRDLKPSNVLVTPEGVPKLLDFGIAKIIQADDGAKTLATMTAMPAMTPEYASPEQIEGTHATTLSDVYSLGAVLYALLSGHPPYRLQNRSRQEIAKSITTTQLEKPSARVSRTEDARRLRGDLDNIVLMAMRRDTTRRYRSVEQFSEDIRRHLAGRPVIARADTLSYRAGKFLQRNKLGIAAAALLLVTLVGGIIATSWQAQRAGVEQARAERRFNEVRKLANSVLFDYHDAIQALPGATKVRERLVRDALTYLDSLAGEAQGDLALQRELAAAYERVGDVRGGVSGGNLGDLAGALESYTKALRIRETLLALNPADIQARRDLAVSRQKIGDRLVDTGETSNGLEHLRKARTLYLDLIREQPADDDLQLKFADTCNKLGSALKSRGDLDGAVEQFRAALAICERLAAHNPREQRYRRALWSSHQGMASVLFVQNKVPEAIEVNGKALELGKALIAEDPINADYRRQLVMNYKNGGDYRKFTDKDGALEYFRRAVTLQEELLAADPANAVTRKDLGYTHKRIADFLANLNDNSQALSHFSKARDNFEKLAADAPGDLPLRFRAAACGAGVAGMQAKLGEVDSALQECRKAIAILGEITEDATNADHRFLRAEAYQYLGYAYVALAAAPHQSTGETRKHWSAARDMLQQSLDVLEGLRSRGALNPANEKWAKGIAGEIVNCDTALAK